MNRQKNNGTGLDHPMSIETRVNGFEIFSQGLREQHVLLEEKEIKSISFGWILSQVQKTRPVKNRFDTYHSCNSPYSSSHWLHSKSFFFPFLQNFLNTYFELQRFIVCFVKLLPHPQVEKSKKQMQKWSLGKFCNTDF